MGIQGLLQFLKEASEPVNVKKYKGQTVAVDTYCWLHKGAFSCADKLAKGEPTDQYVAYCMKLVHMLQSHGVRPILVFDGCTLPSKKDVERTRREKRQLNLQKGKQLLREGKLSEARDCFSRAVNITSEMAHNVITAARSEGVDCIVAPYEADAQLAYLNKNGFAQAVITEDSDLLAFGCKTVILKMDKFGNGLEIDQDRFGLCRHLGDVFTEEKFRYMCILSGCDYLPSIHGIGLVKASKLLKVANNPDITQVIKKMGQYLKTSITVPEDYVRGFIQANNTFLYQMVFDPVRRKLVPLSPYEDGMDPRDLSYAGANIGDSAAYQIAIGNVDVNTMEEIDDYNPDNPQSSRPSGHSWSPPPSLPPHSIWRRHSTSGTQVKTKVESKPKSRGLILPSTRSQVKRPPEGEESDLFRQYSSPQNKKLKMESEEERPEVKHEERPEGSANHTMDAGVRNRFSLLRKNEKSDSISAPGTRSRFFCKPSDLVSDFVDVKRISNGTNMETSETCEISTGATSAPQRKPRNCFSWSGRLSTSPLSSPHLSTSPLSSPHLSTSPLSSPHLSTSPLSSPHLSSGGPGPLSSGGPGPLSLGGPGPPSPLSSSLLSLRQFQRSKNVLDSNMEDECAPPPTSAVLTSSENTSATVEMEDSSSEDKTEESPPEISAMASPAPRTVAKVSGLLKPKRLDPRSGSKLRPLVPAKASGLRGRAARNNENQPALQATIRDLWKNFSFKK